MPNALIVLAAGRGTRMQSDMPKVLHEVAGAPLLLHALESARGLDVSRRVVVTGHGADEVEAAARAYVPDVVCVRQEEQLGTGHAVLQAKEALQGHDGPAFVLYGDTPFIQPETLTAMVEALEGSALVVLGFEAADPGRYGRLVTEGERLLRIVEFKDASEQERAITLCTSGVLAGEASLLMELLGEVTNENAAGEYYLTDLPGLAGQRGLVTRVVRCDEAETMGVNSRADLAQASAAFQARARANALEIGVTMDAPDTVHLSFDTVLGRDCHVEPNVVFGPGATVETGARIRAFSHLEGCHVSRGAVVGPYARLRPGTEVAEDVRVGNFVEIKNAELGVGAKVNHLSYIGDADIGERTNVGAGTVTCNYDGVLKHRTEVGKQAFIGSNTMLVAPVSVGDEAMTASGSVITQNVPDGALAVARGRQVNKEGLARKLMARLKEIKAKRGK
ncbi:MAG: bifunctional UDP-N-acetylglucosamine diphosphorylase/glucosamine-1-phosphate N-acetyltransferase GlmU [Pseudomonadota bacterium]